MLKTILNKISLNTFLSMFLKNRPQFYPTHIIVFLDPFKNRTKFFKFPFLKISSQITSQVTISTFFKNFLICYVFLQWFYFLTIFYILNQSALNVQCVRTIIKNNYGIYQKLLWKLSISFLLCRIYNEWNRYLISFECR